MDTKVRTPTHAEEVLSVVRWLTQWTAELAAEGNAHTAPGEEGGEGVWAAQVLMMLRDVRTAADLVRQRGTAHEKEKAAQWGPNLWTLVQQHKLYKQGIEHARVREEEANRAATAAKKELEEAHTELRNVRRTLAGVRADRERDRKVKERGKGAWDTLQVTLERDQLEAQQEALLARVEELERSAAATAVELREARGRARPGSGSAGAGTELGLRDGGLTREQLDEAVRNLKEMYASVDGDNGGEGDRPKEEETPEERKWRIKAERGEAEKERLKEDLREMRKSRDTERVLARGYLDKYNKLVQKQKEEPGDPATEGEGT